MSALPALRAGVEFLEVISVPKEPPFSRKLITSNNLTGACNADNEGISVLRDTYSIRLGGRIRQQTQSITVV